MEFIKKHYEKVVLGLVILGLGASAALLPFIISDKKERLKKFRLDLTNPKVKELDPLDMVVQSNAWQRAQGIYVLDLTTKHNTFNPVLWQKDATGKPIKVTGANMDGVGLIEVTAVRELYLSISYGTNTANGYFIKVEKQSALSPGARTPHDATVYREGDKNSAYIVKGLKGPADNPTELTIEAKDFNEPIVIAPGKPFKKVDGYAADLKYKGEPTRAFTDQRVGNTLVFGPGNQYHYKIVAITTNGVIVSAESNKKNTSIPFNPSH